MFKEINESLKASSVFYAAIITVFITGCASFGTDITDIEGKY